MNKKRVVVRYGFGAEGREELERQAPPSVELLFPRDNDEFMRFLPEAEGIYGHIGRGEFPVAAKLNWVQLNATGFESLQFPEMENSQVIVTGISGLLAVPVAEHALALLLCLARGLHLLRDQQSRHAWKVVQGVELADMAALILGAGNIGRRLAGRLTALGMRHVRGIDPMPAPLSSGFHEIWGLERLDEAVAEADVLFVCCPLTPETRDLIDAERIDLMPAGGMIINVSRGGIVNEAALLRAIQTGRLAGAGLDVTDEEPLPPDNPLWSEPGIIITSHSAGHSPWTRPRKMQRFLVNLHNWSEGKPMEDVIPITRFRQP